MENGIYFLQDNSQLSRTDLALIYGYKFSIDRLYINFFQISRVNINMSNANSYAHLIILFVQELTLRKL